MSLLRMLAFKPVTPEQATSVSSNPAAVSSSSAKKKKTGAGAKAVSNKSESEPVAKKPPTSGEWSEVVVQLGLSGVNQQLANNTVRESFKDDELTLVLDETFADLHSREREQALSDALENYYGKKIRIVLRIEKPPKETPAQTKIRQTNEQQQAAVEAIDNDPNISALQEQFNAQVNPGSSRSKVEAGSK